jgi:uncharacterized membrane protein
VSLIDQRILIVAPVETVWIYVADPTTMTKWLQNCKQISVLSTRTTGVGTRRRCIDARGRAEVLETTAYFENIGYEYKVVDGPYREFRGRFRLQAIPEGTIVNWTVEYRLRGPLAGLRNLLSFRRRFEDMMADSLRGLRKLVESSGIRLDPDKHARFAMQDGPSRGARAARSPEMTRTGATKPGSGALRPVAVSEDDVPEISPSDIAAPTVARTPPPPPETAGTPSQPEPLEDAVLSDTKPRAPKGLRQAIASQRRSEEVRAVSEEDAEDGEQIARAQSAPTVPISLVAPPPEPPQETQTVEIAPPPPWPGVPETLPERTPAEPPKKEPKKESKKESPVGAGKSTGPDRSLEDTGVKRPSSQPPEPAEAEEEKPLPTDKTDTGQVSIWEVFGLERPSEKTAAELEGLIAAIKPKPEDGQPPVAVKPTKVQPRRKAKPRVRGTSSKHPPRQKRSVHARPPGTKNRPH